ncbi:hypothetical protein [Streptomyces capitiformicae]|uniref:Uncharacterized protein n=1 Tax=Streptomyces capitiformicae TaxID=2014920 RepID=A0A918Z0Y0_9ACTN|nr:hypothetical protein [Streptomyces capitiformicae]GHE33116.1 hypothetical protein GCM10017771_50120 [Streptomyces capitiformicae]
MAPAAGCALYARLEEPGSYAADALPTLLLFGVGFMLAFGALNMRASSGLRPADKGVGTAVYQAAVPFGAVVVLVVVALLLGRGDGAGPATGDGLAYQDALLLVTAVAGAGALVALAGALRRSP